MAAKTLEILKSLGKHPWIYLTKLVGLFIPMNGFSFSFNTPTVSSLQNIHITQARIVSRISFAPFGGLTKPKDVKERFHNCEATEYLLIFFLWGCWTVAEKMTCSFSFLFTYKACGTHLNSFFCRLNCVKTASFVASP